jgi:hypothetical protein
MHVTLTDGHIGCRRYGADKRCIYLPYHCCHATKSRPQNIIPGNVRFQVGLPSPYNVLLSRVKPELVWRLNHCMSSASTRLLTGSL